MGRNWVQDVSFGNKSIRLPDITLYSRKSIPAGIQIEKGSRSQAFLLMRSLVMAHTTFLGLRLSFTSD